MGLIVRTEGIFFSTYSIFIDLDIRMKLKIFYIFTI